jgi:arylsulfatase A-like enzyme
MTARIRAAGAEALLVAALVGLVEALLVGRSFVMVAALAITGWSLAAVVVRGAVAAGLRLEPISTWRAELATNREGEPDVTPVVAGSAVGPSRRIRRGVVAFAALGVFSAIAFRVVAWIHVAYRFRDAGPVALLVMTIIIPLALVTIVGALAIDRRVALAKDRRAARGPRPVGSRARATWRGALTLVALALFGVIGFLVIAWIHVVYRFHDPVPVALVTVGMMIVLALAIAMAARAVDRRVAPRMTFDLAGRRGYIAVAIAAVIGVVLPVAVVAVAIPAIGLGAVTCASLLLVGVIVARAARLGTRRFVQPLAVGGLVLAVTGSLLMGRAPAARAAAIEQGVASTRVVRRLLALGDRDGDGYAGRFGGADCDDADPARNPAAIDIIGNGIDENCTGADAVARNLDASGTAGRRSERSHAERPDILLISIDALRADHLSAWGYARPTSPAIDQLAAAGTRFAWAVTPSPTTRHALPALLDGRYASLAQRDGRPGSLAEVLQAAGYATGAVLCGDRLVSPDALRGFQDVDRSAEAARAASPGLDNAGAVVDAALRWWAKQTSKQPPHMIAPPLGDAASSPTVAATRAPAFMWVHLYEPHHPYVAPPGSPDFGSREVDRYDAEIAAADRELARLFAAVDPARTIIVLAADHGEEFGEHGIRFHARSLYNQVIRVPLIVRAPDSRGQVVDAPVSLVDVMPTVLELAAVTPPPGLSGLSLAPAVRGASPGTASPLATRALLLELPPDRQITRDLVGAIAGPWKVVWDREANAWSLFALVDVADEHDLAESDSATLATMQQILFELVDLELSAP